MHWASTPRSNLSSRTAAQSLIVFLYTAMSTKTNAFTIRIQGSGVPSVNQEYEWKPPTIIPKGFARVCIQNQWNVESTWERLNGGRNWLHAPNDAYIYLNSIDNHWWVDEPGGNGVFIAPESSTQLLASQVLGEKSSVFAPPDKGWKTLSGGIEALPKVEVIQ